MVKGVVRMKIETMKNVAGIILLYVIIILGVVLVNARMGEINESTKVISLER